MYHKNCSNHKDSIIQRRLQPDFDFGGKIFICLLTPSMPIDVTFTNSLTVAAIVSPASPAQATATVHSHSMRLWTLCFVSLFGKELVNNLFSLVAFGHYHWQKHSTNFRLKIVISKRQVHLPMVEVVSAAKTNAPMYRSFYAVHRRFLEVFKKFSWYIWWLYDYICRIW